MKYNHVAIVVKQNSQIGDGFQVSGTNNSNTFACSISRRRTHKWRNRKRVRSKGISLLRRRQQVFSHDREAFGIGQKASKGARRGGYATVSDFRRAAHRDSKAESEHPRTGRPSVHQCDCGFRRIMKLRLTRQICCSSRLLGTAAVLSATCRLPTLSTNSAQVRSLCELGSTSGSLSLTFRRRDA